MKLFAVAVYHGRQGLLAKATLTLRQFRRLLLGVLLLSHILLASPCLIPNGAHKSSSPHLFELLSVTRVNSCVLNGPLKLCLLVISHCAKRGRVLGPRLLRKVVPVAYRLLQLKVGG